MAQKVIDIQGLSYVYPDGIRALEDLSLEILEGESVGLIGPNGAGKSTLLFHLNGILKGKGSVNVLGRDLMDEKGLPFIRSNVGLVFQDPDNQLFMPTVFDDVAFGPANSGLNKDEVEKAVLESLKYVDMLHCIRRQSHHLSLGEKKRVSIATVLSMNPKILVMDEPSSNLDPRNRRNLINLLKAMKLTKIIATHDLDLVLEVCEKVFLLDKGRIVAYGRVMDILSDSRLLEKHSLEAPLAFGPLCRNPRGVMR